MRGRRSAARSRPGIQARVLGLAVLFTLLTAAVLMVGSMRTLSAQLRRSALQSAEYTVQAAADSIRQDILEIDALPSWCALNYTARAAMLTDLSTSTLAHTAYPIISNRYYAMRTALYIQRFLIVTNNGRIIMMGTAANQSQPVTSGNVGLFPGMGEGDSLTQWELLTEDPLIQPGSTVTGIPVANRISDWNKTASARIYLSICPTLITDTLKKFNAEQGEWLCWVMGGRLYRVDGDQLVDLGEASQLPAPGAGPGDTLDEATLLYSTRLDGVDCQLVMRPLGLHGLCLGQVIPNELLVSPLHLLLQPALASLGIVIVMGLGMAVLLRRVVVSPIGALQRQIEAVSQGDFSANPAIEWDHELGDVGRGINRLSRSVSDLMAKRLEDEKQRLDLEYRMLQNQISPHFIYNTLNSIKWMATIQHAPGVAEMVTALSRLLKSVSKGTRRLVPLRDEFALLEDYFTIQRYRYGGTITLDAALDSDGPAQDYLIPRFTLQPLAENAIFHGIEPKGGVGRLEVTAAQAEEGDDLLIRLTDDGVGMTGEQIARILTGGMGEDDIQFRHIGVWNVHRLLQLSFGPAYGLRIESTPGEGTSVIVRLPRPEPDGTS